MRLKPWLLKTTSLRHPVAWAAGFLLLTLAFVLSIDVRGAWSAGWLFLFLAIVPHIALVSFIVGVWLFATIFVHDEDGEERLA